MTMTILTTGDLAELSGYTPEQIRNFCDAGILVPEQNGSGRGCFRLFSTMQAVSLAYAAPWAAAGYPRALVKKIADSIADMSERKLLAKFRQGKTHLIPDLDGPMQLIKWHVEGGEIFDLKACYDAVQRKIREIAAKYPDAVRLERRGRRTGLAAGAKAR